MQKIVPANYMSAIQKVFYEFDQNLTGEKEKVSSQRSPLFRVPVNWREIFIIIFILFNKTKLNTAT